jgi:hypothetical protein
LCGRMHMCTRSVVRARRKALALSDCTATHGRASPDRQTDRQTDKQHTSRSRSISSLAGEGRSSSVPSSALGTCALGDLVLSTCAGRAAVRMRVKTGLRIRQKRPTDTAKETYVYGKRDQCVRQKRPTYTAKETNVYGKRDLRIRQKRPPTQTKETHPH